MVSLNERASESLLNAGADRFNRSRYLLWIGSIFTEEAALTHRAISLAANRWQCGLLEAVIAQGVSVEIIGHLPEPMWPRGPMWVQGNDRLHPYGCHSVSYLNAPFVRSASLGRSLQRAVADVVSRRGSPAVMLTYNVSQATENLAKFTRDRFATPWVPVIADLDGDWPVHSSSLQLTAAGCVLLSWHCFVSSALGPPRLHLDGGIRLLRATRSTEVTKAFLYSGALNQFGGIDFLLSAFRLVRDQSAELWVCGKGHSPELRKAQIEDPRIKWFGAVTDAVLEDLSARAWAFVNPRPPHVTESQSNFPSKILEYLSYGKPVASTWTLGLAPEYRQVLDLPIDESEGAFAKLMEDLLSESAETRGRRERVISDFLLGSRTWNLQASRLIEWLRATIDGMTIPS